MRVFKSVRFIRLGGGGGIKHFNHDGKHLVSRRDNYLACLLMDFRKPSTSWHSFAISSFVSG